MNIYDQEDYTSMPQSAVPDVNIGIITHRDLMKRAIIYSDQKLFLTGLHAINGAMDESLKLRFISSKEHKQINQPKSTIVSCGKCGKESDHDKVLVKIRNHTPGMDNVLLKYTGIPKNGRKYVKCKHCGLDIFFDNLKSSVIINEVIDVFDSSYLIPNPPPHSGSIIDNVYHSVAFWKWAMMVLSITEDRLRKFRLMYSVSDGDDGGSSIES